MKKTHWRNCDKTDFLGSADIDEMLSIIDDPQIIDIDAIIQKVEIKTVKVRGKSGTFRIATFEDKKLKPMILNVGNSKIVKGFASNKPHVEEWIDIPVTIYIDENVRMGAEMTEGLRFRKVLPKSLKLTLKSGTPAYEKVLKYLRAGKSMKAVTDKYIIDEKKLLIDVKKS